MKFNKDDRISLGGIPGTIASAWEATAFRDRIYEVTFDGHNIKKDALEELRINRFTADWFDEHAEPYTDPKPTAAKFFDSLVPGDRFTVVNRNGVNVWEGDYAIYLSIKHSNDSGTMIRGLRHGYDTAPIDLFLIDSDTLTKIE